MKALCRERLIDWHKKFGDYGIKCISLTSDTDDIDTRNIFQYNLIIATPEKWDVLTRKWRDNLTFIAAINLFMIDEVHLLNADSRGSTLEVIVSRMKTAEAFLMLNLDKTKIRFIALSATVPNVVDIAEWIEPTGTAKYFKFSEDVRPVKLDKVVYGFNATSKSTFKFDLNLNYKIPNIITKHSKGKPTLIFCSTRKSVEMTTNHLVTNLQIRLSQEQKDILNQISRQISDAKLRQYIVHGIALHHAGLVPENRNVIETSFRDGHLPILVTTSTLAMGVNLPAHLVIIKGTKRYDTNEGFKDYDEVSIFQMIGRAGRCQFDISATAVILTSTQDRIKYEQMLNCNQIIESNLHKHLTEHLNAEIVLKTITDLEVAMNWLSSTFLYVRARKSPEKYKLPAGVSKEKIDKKLLEICQIDLNKLVRAGMIKMNQAIEVAPTVIGEIMAKYYIAFNTMELFTKISGNEIMIQVLAIFSKCHEFSEIYLRSNDKKCLNLLNKNTYKESIRFSLTGRIKTVDMKINCIIQAVLGNLDISDQSILNDSIRVMRNCVRLANCLIEYLETRTKCYTPLLNIIILAKCFHAKLWENSPYVSKQLTGVGQVMSTLLAKAGKTTFKEIVNTNPRHIEMIVGRKSPFGSTIIDEAIHLPEYQMFLQKQNNDVNLVINLLNPSVVEEKPTANLFSKMTLLVGDSDNNILLYEKYAHSYMLDHPKVTRSVNIENQNITFVIADLISEDWVGIDCHAKLELLTKPTDATNQPTNRTQNKNSKQTSIEMYMQQVKKGNNKTKNEAHTVSKKNPCENHSDTIPQDKTVSKENRHQTLMKNKDYSMIYEKESTNATDTNLYKSDKNLNEKNYDNGSQSINKNYLEPKEDMQQVKKGNNKTKNEAQTVSKKNPCENQSDTIPQDKTVSKEYRHQNLMKNKDYSMIYEKESTNARDTNLYKSDKNLNEKNYDHGSRSINKNYLEPKEAEINSTLEVEQKTQNSARKSTYSKKKKIVMSNSIFRTKSKSKHREQLKKRAKYKDMENIENESSCYLSIEGSVTKKRKSPKSQYNEKQDELKNDEASNNKFQIQVLNNDDKPIIQKSARYESEYLEELFPNRSQMNSFEKNKATSGKCRLKPEKADDPNRAGSEEIFPKLDAFKINKTISEQYRSKVKNADYIDRAASEELVQYESQINAIMDAFERKTNIMEERKSGLNNEESHILDDINIFKNLNNNSTSQDNNKINIVPNKNKSNTDMFGMLKTPTSHKKHDIISKVFDNNASEQCSQIDCDYGNKDSRMNVSKVPFILESKNNPINKNNDKPSGLKALKQVVNTTLLKYLDNYTDNNDCDRTLNESDNKSTTLQVSMSPKYYGGSKIYSRNKSPQFANDYQNNLLLNNGVDIIRSRKDDKALENNDNNLFPEALRDSKLSALYNKYNPDIQLRNQDSNQSHEEKQNYSFDKKPSVEESRGKNIMATMDYPYSTIKRGPIQKEDFLTPPPKRYREVEDYSSYFEGSQPKRIKWRSPLVHSPPENSPQNFCFDFGDVGSNSKKYTKESNDIHLGSQDTSGSGTNLNLTENSQKLSDTSSSTLTKKKLTFPLCDEDYIDKNNSFHKNIKYLEDICDLELFGLVNRQGSLEKVEEKKYLQSTSSVGEYYSQLMSSQLKNLKKDTQANEKTEGQDIVTNYESVSQPTLISSQKIRQSPISDANFSNPDSMLPCSQYHYPKPLQTHVHTKNIPFEPFQQYSMEAYNPQLPNVYQPNNLYCSSENRNYITDIGTGHPKIPMQRYPANDDSIHHSFVSLQKQHGELPQRRSGDYYFDEGKYTLQPNPYFIRQQPSLDETKYQHQEMPPYPIPSKYISSTDLRCPLPRYGNIDPYFKESYPGFMYEPNYPVEHINHQNPRITPTYHSQINPLTEPSIDEYTRHTQQQGNNHLHYTLSESNKNQGQSMNQFKPSNPFERKSLFSENTQNYRSNLFSQANPYEYENHESQLFQNNENNCTFGQTYSRPTILNNQSQSNNPSGPSNSKIFLQNNQKLEGLSKNNISQIFSPLPKRQYQHNSSLNIAQSRKSSLPKTPHPHLMVTPSHQRNLNFNSLEKRLDNIILPTNQGFTREQHYDPRTNFNATSYQPNDKKFIMNKFLFPNDRN